MSPVKRFDYIIIGAGIYGLYAASLLARKNVSIAILEKNSGAFQEASFINQARIHNGYHYPRSLSTARKTASYFKRFNEEFAFAVNNSFKQIYAIAKDFSFTNADQFESFCRNANIPYQEVFLDSVLNYETIEKAYETEEYSFDAEKIRDHFLSLLAKNKNVQIFYNTHPVSTKKDQLYHLVLNDGTVLESGYVINTTYAHTNQVIDLFGFEPLKIKYELCEVVLCKVSDNLKELGITVMDGPFFSLMPFGLTGHHSLTAVEFTPHKDSHERITPFINNHTRSFEKQKTAYPIMRQLTKKYLSPHTEIAYSHSHFAVKPILAISELTDSRPTIIKELSSNPTFITVLSGKINTIYDLDQFLL